MLPFPILGFVIKPLQLKGDFFSLMCFRIALIFLILVTVMHYLTFNVGFAPLESKHTPSIETNVSETGGILILLSITL